VNGTERLVDEDLAVFTLRTELKPGDIGTITYLHGVIYHAEKKHGIAFEAYVAEGLAEFFHNYQAGRDHVWIYEHDRQIIGTLFLMDRQGTAQLRYYFVLPEYRGQGIGKDLMRRYMRALHDGDYPTSFLWTTNELPTAAALYMRHGFVLTEERPSTRFGKAVVEQKYEWRKDTR
jgi:GNAT superfamily N-acetyltransferase